MRNTVAVAFVVVFLAACGQYVYTNTHPSMDLINRTALGDEQWREHIKSGGLLR